eukprot:CAMPEP_0184314474 /NCGR_PEP_ID=MMETSP1049-20130417/74466_1 /TAXON_ID=77928 /ORGANISM="Proteomonas sulcata, Strain CCMP704" /LENGTH=56 /DNA_ID=CAMNT_0026632407 /DNA_START=212 /DNA_END=382 /DNA_ORIENTATION=-
MTSPTNHWTGLTFLHLDHDHRHGPYQAQQQILECQFQDHLLMHALHPAELPALPRH